MNEIWESYGLSPELVNKLQASEIEQPTPVQAAAIPALISGNDVSARSQTGTGKTLAYLLPALQRVDTASSSLQVMILAPTQELAMQIVRVAESYGEPIGVRVQQLIGGASVHRQMEKLKQHPHLIVGTPGRIHEIVASGKLKLHHIRLLVIDEADQVFSLGSTKEVETLLKGMVRDRQIAFFSATRPKPMEEVELRWMRDPQVIEVTSDQNIASRVEHYYLVCDKRDKVDTARRLIRLLEPAAALLFINETDEIANYEAKFGYEGFVVETLYGDADKQRRAATLTRFREGRCQLLLATDIAARGLDIADLPLVVHLDPALDADHYVHRSGRTGRMGKPGTVVSIVTPQQLFIMDKFSKQLGIDLQEKEMYRGRLWNPEELQASRLHPRNGSRHNSSPGTTNNWGAGAAVQADGDAPSSGEGAPRSGNPMGISSRNKAAGKSRSTGGASKPVKAKAASKPNAPVKSARQLKREKKDKGAPKWLKAKREGQGDNQES
ncbi:DEAD/DEAH box helicase [Paenibacillus mendelii]|uniref:DEAD/DEAH box helicase n=1 Tax=Paenibacillus mendelii TaxID=206163 RepID=A0ABV6J8W1_9BACL|nr:DEAD/DEAH box helicase [Paenibacillus mendelii]MCQ6559663.1 DEAD/DEAH box helicase [Paenibacillus mendelii]